MKKTPILLLFTLILILLCSGLFAEENANATYARQVFDKLYTGDLNVIEQIDWSNFNVIGNDFSVDYSQMDTAEKIRYYQETLISGFSAVCDDADLTPDNLIDWTDESGSDNVTVYADFYPDWLYMIFSNTGGKLLLKQIAIEYDDEY